MLLEILLALALFVFAAAVVGSAMHTAQTATREMRRQAEAANLAQTVLADLASGRMELADATETVYGLDEAGGEVDPDDARWTYEIVTEDLTDASNLLRVTVIVRSADSTVGTTCRLTQWMLVPPGAEPADGELDEGFEEGGR
ncbi:MAG: competence system putative prepilin ComGE [Planctomycetota bacterium]|jgi:type II secretory pathway pseudopilin PulG